MNAHPPTERRRTHEWQEPSVDFARMATMDGLAQMQAFKAEGRIAPIASTMDFELVEVDKGFAAFEGVPGEFHYNPIGTVHGGYAATLLDSALGCCIHANLPIGMAYTTVELKVNMVRAITKRTGRVRAEGRVIHFGGRLATAEATLKSLADGKLLAHGSTTCMVFPLAEAASRA